jgi:hypothetical protein
VAVIAQLCAQKIDLEISVFARPAVSPPAARRGAFCVDSNDGTPVRKALVSYANGIVFIRFCVSKFHLNTGVVTMLHA